VRPLLDCRFGTDRVSSALLRAELNALAAKARADGRLGAIAIDVRDLQSGAELVIDAGLKFRPASLFKLPTVLAVLRIAERDPALLDRELVFEPQTALFRQEIAVATRLVPGRSYTVRQLVEQAITESDNQAVDTLPCRSTRRSSAICSTEATSARRCRSGRPTC
jgi:beta-lactamase class A